LNYIRLEKFVRHLISFFGFVILFHLASAGLYAQDNYEIQVYGSETVAPKTTMVELHSNFTADGFKSLPGSSYTADGLRPTNHAEHETVEITQGITPWAELGFYIFTAYQSSYGYQWVGDHIRPRVRAPESWHLPVGLSISNEIGYQRARFFPDSWTWEIRPIIDKQAGRYYLSFNPTFDRAFHGPGIKDGVVFAPNIKVGYDFTKKINAGIEYYGSTGPVSATSTFHDQQHQFFAVTDLNVSPAWEINFGVGVGVTGSTDHLIVKGILGRRFDWGHHKSESSGWKSTP
jgi:hypothetical protein